MTPRAFLLTVLAFCAAPVFSQSVGELMMASLFGNAGNITMKITMQVSAANGSKERGIDVFIRRDRGTVKMLAHVVSPAYLSQMKFLTHHLADGQTSSWLKTSQGVRKLSRVNDTERIFDSDFTAEDFGPINQGEFIAEVRDDEVVGGAPCAVLELRSKQQTSYVRKVLFIGKEDSQLRGIDFYDESATLIRQYRLLETRIVDGFPFPASSVMKDLRGKTETRLSVGDIDTSHPLPDRVFNKADM